ncbi:MAG: 4-hydroxy-3-methylbut-2-enyl diphosphate reductase [Wolinella sp.]
MRVKLADKHGFCFGVKRAIKLAESHQGGTTLGPLIHNKKEIDRLKSDFNVSVSENVEEIPTGAEVIIRTHGIPKNDLAKLTQNTDKIINATCPFVTKPQKICEQMSADGYQIVIFGDINHPEVQGVMSYSLSEPIVVINKNELDHTKIADKVALVSQTTKKIADFLDLANYLIEECAEVRIFNTICNATFDNQDAARRLSQEVDVMVIVGGKNSSNTKQLLSICLENCNDSYLIEDEGELNSDWFVGKNLCGVTAGASTPEWIIERVVKAIEGY